MTDYNELCRLRRVNSQLRADLDRMAKLAAAYKRGRKRVLNAYIESKNNLLICAELYEEELHWVNKSLAQHEASYARDREMFTARERQKREHIKAECLAERCPCRVGDCQSRRVCGLSGRRVKHG